MEETEIIKNFEEISLIFLQEKSNTPFKNCKICNKELIENNERYIIEKAYHQDLTKLERSLVFEFAYCLDCLDQMRAEFSIESKQKLDSYFVKNSDLEKRQTGLTANNLFDVDLWLQNCIVKNESIDEVEEFQILALCEGGDMLYHYFPYMICGNAMEEVANLLSNKTLDMLNDFLIDNIDVPPELEEIFKSKKPILL
jgi:hypothetical protein